jgi:hypothetical protein
VDSYQRNGKYTKKKYKFENRKRKICELKNIHTQRAKKRVQFAGEKVKELRNRGFNLKKKVQSSSPPYIHVFLSPPPPTPTMMSLACVTKQMQWK